MDNRARAEEIADAYCEASHDHAAHCVKFFESKLDEACKLTQAMGYVQGQIDGTKREEKKWCGRGFAAGIEKAAQVAVDELNLIAGPGISPKETDLAYGACIDIAKRIRVLKVDE